MGRRVLRAVSGPPRRRAVGGPSYPAGAGSLLPLWRHGVGRPDRTRRRALAPAPSSPVDQPPAETDTRLRWTDAVSAACRLREHLPDLQTFACLTCGAAWPCRPARQQLALLPAPHRGVLLAAVLGLAYEVLPGEGLYERFLLDGMRP